MSPGGLVDSSEEARVGEGEYRVCLSSQEPQEHPGTRFKEAETLRVVARAGEMQAQWSWRSPDGTTCRGGRGHWVTVIPTS